MIKINLGLKNNPHKSKEDIKLLFSNNFIVNNDTFDFKIIDSKYIEPKTNKEVIENTAVFNIHTKHQKNIKDVEYNLQQLCSIFNQDSIAYYSFILNTDGIVHNKRYKGKKYTFNLDYFNF